MPFYVVLLVFEFEIDYDDCCCYLLNPLDPCSNLFLVMKLRF